MNIYVYTGPVKSGKTTKLMQWASDQKNIDGIFQPVVDGKRYIYHIGSRTLKMLETQSEKSNEEILEIGEYRFLKNTFSWCQKILKDCLNKNIEWLIIDEVGPLELKGKGLEPGITELLNSKNNFSGNVVFVVRDSMLEKFVEHYKLDNKYDLINQKLFCL